MLCLGCVPEATQNLDTPHFDRRGLRVLVFVDHVLVETFGHQLLGLRFHPRRHEGGEIHARVAVQHQLVVDDLISDVGRHLALCQLELWNIVALASEKGCDRRLACRVGASDRHGLTPARSPVGVKG
jgi:hypothetical protein